VEACAPAGRPAASSWAATPKGVPTERWARPTPDQPNLPVQPTPFVGRERELAEVLALLDSHGIVRRQPRPNDADRLRLGPYGVRVVRWHRAS
jgi:hypothetical protein